MAAELKRSLGTYYAALDAGHRARRSRGTSGPFVHQLWWRVLVAGAALWRIARRPYALDRVGIGAERDGGRWNLPGTAVIYAGQSIAICALEQFVHLAGVTPSDLVLVRIELPDDYSAERPALASLPSDWDAVPAGPGSMQFGTQWAQTNRTLVLYVPSALVREEGNAVLNPNHPEFAGVAMRIERSFSYDPRMYLARARRHQVRGR